MTTDRLSVIAVIVGFLMVLVGIAGTVNIWAALSIGGAMIILAGIKGYSRD